MSYQVLARKWRPRLLSEMVGQSHVRRVLSHSLDSGRLHHAYLFSGTRGVGKTTLARIMAKCLNCEKGVRTVPCGECAACRDIDQGSFIDLIEVDAASRSKVEETREMMDKVQYGPSAGRFKVYLIDEIHMFSNHSFNALLKTLEEPPPHVKFLMATTEPKKLPVTVLSRCIQFNLRHLGIDQISGQLSRILKEEGISNDEASVQLLAQAAAGSMRDGLSLLDQAISHGSGQLHETQVREMLGTVDYVNLSAVIEAIVSTDGKSLLKAIADLSAFGPDYQAVLTEILSLLQRAALAQAVPQQVQDILHGNELAARLANGLDKETVQLYYQLVLKSLQDMSFVPDQRSAFEMALVRLLAFRFDDGKELEKQKNTEASRAKPEPEEGWQAHSGSTVARTVSASTPPSARSVRQVSASPATVSSTQENLRRWEEVVTAMDISGLAKQLALACIIQDLDSKRIHLAIRPHDKGLLNSRSREILRVALQKHFGVKFHVEIEERDYDGVNLTTLFEERQRKQRSEELELYKNESVVAGITKVFGAQMDEQSFQPPE